MEKPARLELPTVFLGSLFARRLRPFPVARGDRLDLAEENVVRHLGVTFDEAQRRHRMGLVLGGCGGFRAEQAGEGSARHGLERNVPVDRLYRIDLALAGLDVDSLRPGADDRALDGLELPGHLLVFKLRGRPRGEGRQGLEAASAHGLDPRHERSVFHRFPFRGGVDRFRAGRLDFGERPLVIACECRGHRLFPSGAVGLDGLGERLSGRRRRKSRVGGLL